VFGVCASVAIFSFNNKSEQPQALVEVPEPISAASTWGCGKQGQCWTHCSWGSGWCYNTAANVCTTEADCDEDNECVGPCNWWKSSSLTSIPEPVNAVVEPEPIVAKSYLWGCGKKG